MISKWLLLRIISICRDNVLYYELKGDENMHIGIAILADIEIHNIARNIMFNINKKEHYYHNIYHSSNHFHIVVRLIC